MTHTIGPWRACHDGECPCGFIWGGDHETHVASAHGPSALGQDWYGADLVCNSPTQQANALLIAAAPDLLEAAKRTIAENLHLADGDNCTLRHLTVAIAKAEGRTPALTQPSGEPAS